MAEGVGSTPEEPKKRRRTRIPRDGESDGRPPVDRTHRSTPLRDDEPAADTERTARRRGPTPEEERAYVDIVNKIRAGMAAMDEADAFKAAPLIYGPDPDAAAMLDRLGITPDEYTKYAYLHKQFFGGPVRDLAQNINNAYLAEKLQNAAEELSIQNVLKRFFTPEIGPDGNPVIFGTEKRKELQHIVTKYFYHFFEEVDKDPTKLYTEIYEPFVHGYYINGLEGLLAEISNNKDIKELLKNDQTDARGFLYALGGEAKTLKNFGQLFHDLPIYALNPDTHEQWKGFIAQMWPSQLAKFYDDPIMKSARSEITRYIKQRIAENGNQVPEDIFDGMYNENTVTYQHTDHNYLRDILKKRLRDLGIDAEPWQIDRAISYGRGVGLLNLQDVQTMGLGDPNPSIRDIPGLIGKMWQRHKWKQGRGGPHSHMHVPELLTMDVVHNPESRSYISRLLKRRKWVPSKVHDLAKKKVMELGEELDYKLLDREGAFQELMNILNLPSQFDRAGWRVDFLQPEGGEVRSDIGRKIKQAMMGEGIPIKEGQKIEDRIEWGIDEWHKFYDVITKELGSGALQFYLDKRVKAESYRMVAKALNLPMDHLIFETALSATPEQLKKAKEQRLAIAEAVKKYEKESPLKKIPFKSGPQLTFYEIKQKLEAEIKGENFYYLFHRSPGDFLLNLQLLVPDLRKPDSKLWGDEKNLTIQDHLILEKWGDRKSPGFKKLKEIHEWHNNVIKKYEADGPFMAQLLENSPELQAIDESKLPKEYKRIQRRDIMRHVIAELGTSYERVKLREGVEIKPEDVIDPKIRELLFEDSNALIPKLNEMKPLFEFDHEDRLTDKNFFYLMGRGWTIKNGADNPSTTDLDIFKMYKEIGKSGQGLFRRLHSDLHEWDSKVKTVADLDELLMHAATDGNMSKIYELHAIIHGLEGIAGAEAIKKANYLLGSLVAQYFWEHKAARGLGGIIKTLPARLMLGNDISLSRIHGTRSSMSWDDKAVRGYFYNLAEKHMIPLKGRWSYEQAKLAFDASTDTHATNQLMSAASVLFFYLIFAAAKKAMEEEGGKKK